MTWTPIIRSSIYIAWLCITSSTERLLVLEPNSNDSSFIKRLDRSSATVIQNNSEVETLCWFNSGQVLLLRNIPLLVVEAILIKSSSESNNMQLVDWIIIGEVVPFFTMQCILFYTTSSFCFLVLQVTESIKIFFK